MRLAYFSPLNPQPSGISDYSEELLPYLAAQAEIDLFVDGFTPTNSELISRFRCFDYQSDPETLARLGEYDAVIYHMGNDHRYHSGIARVMQSHPGIVVFHDFALQDFFLGQAREQNDMSIYLDELEESHGKHERLRAEEFVQRGGMPPQVTAPMTFPLNARLARSAEAIIVHSEWNRNQLSRIAPGVPISRVNHHITARAAEMQVRTTGRDSQTQFQIASFGLITPDKGIERALSALSALKEEFRFHYKLVGSAKNFPGLTELVQGYGLENHVSITGHVSLDEFQRLISETDIAINLRERPVGATSGSLCRILAAGVTAIVSNVEPFNELPDDAVVKIDAGEYADALLQAYLNRLMGDRALCKRIAENARNYVLANHDIEKSAAGYINLIKEVVANRLRKSFIDDVAKELFLLGAPVNDERLLRKIAVEVSVLAPAGKNAAELRHDLKSANVKAKPSVSDNGHEAFDKISPDSSGRVSKIEGIDYKRAAVDYLGRLSEERQHHLRTKPFYNLANKPAKYKGEGMDSDMHRHFCDFANIAVALALPPGSRVLDVGCGSGWLSEYFARLGYKVTGIDISPGLIEMSRQRVANLAYGVDHETPVDCVFQVHDIELGPLAEKFDALICYDSLHHLENERAVFRNLAAMLDVGGLLFILEGQKPPAGSTTEDELRDVMLQYGTLESPFSDKYLRFLLDANGLAIVGDYVSINGLFEREMLEGNVAGLSLPLHTLDTDYHYLMCMKVANGGPAKSVPDSKSPGILSAELTPRTSLPETLPPDTNVELPLRIKNTGDTIWLTAQTVRAGIVMPAIRISNEGGKTVSEVHGQPMLPRAIAPGQSVSLDISCTTPHKPGIYTAKIDLVDQHVSWFEEKGSEPLVFSFEVKDKA